MSVVLNTLVPVFSIIALGFVLAARRNLHLPTLADVAVLVTSPALLFSVLAGTALDLRQLGTLAGGTLWVAAGTALLATAYLRLRAPARRGLLLPAVFWNAGNMALPCARLAFGPEGLEAAAIVFVTMAVLTSTAGIWIAKGDGGLREVLHLPLLYGSLGGLALALTGTELPRAVMEPIEMLGSMAIPLMLLNLGMQLRSLRVSELAHSLAAVGIRMVGGPALAAGRVGPYPLGAEAGNGVLFFPR